jgi:DNA-directed RNA polymerase subunit beta'
LLAEMADRPVIMNRNPTLHKFGILAFYPVLNDDNSIKVTPSIIKGYNLDFDGDNINLHVPVTPGAVNEAKEKMLVSKNLLGIMDRKPIHVPAQGTVLGLHFATRPNIKDAPVHVYQSEQEVVDDYNKGILKATDNVIVEEIDYEGE